MSILADHTTKVGVQSGPLIVGIRTLLSDLETAYIVAGQTIRPGSTVTVTDGKGKTTVVLQGVKSDLVVVVDGVSSTISTDYLPATGPQA